MKIDIRYGYPEPYDYDTIIDQFSGTSFKSFQTSSIPLVQFWKDTKARLNELSKEVNLELGETTLCFEYPTKPKKGTGKASMTDLMIITADVKVAIEAKFTEYTPKGSTELISKWLNEGDLDNRKKVLKYWKDLIDPFSDSIDESALLNVEYQFFHRTASACKETQRAIVVYQVFYNVETKEYLSDYIKKLKNYIKVLNPKETLSFYFWEIEAVQKVFEKKETDNPFLIMKKKELYSFGKQRIERIN